MTEKKNIICPDCEFENPPDTKYCQGEVVIEIKRNDTLEYEKEICEYPLALHQAHERMKNPKKKKPVPPEQKSEEKKTKKGLLDELL